ncbi:MAG: caspase family protein [Phormidesmis sp.]
MGSKSGDNRGTEGLNRRAFIQRASAVACALGLAELPFEFNISDRAKDYSQAIADTNGRKLALLIGIDNYADNTLSESQLGPKPLVGAVTDVALQRTLLIHRFGFLPEDVVCLTNQQATRQGIYEAFVSHLYNQATAGDVVVFHFSGYGSQVKVKGSSQDWIGNLTESLAGNLMGSAALRSLVPYDGLLPTKTRSTVNDILEIELKALLKQLKTKKITTVIDAGFVDVALPLSGGLRSRTRSEVITGQMPAPFELLVDKRPVKDGDSFPGVLLRGADVDDIVLERQWNDFNAGAFTYVLTQYLWTAPAPVTTQRGLSRAQETLLRWGGSSQQPMISASQPKETPMYNTPLREGTRGEGVITDVSSDGKSVTVWLGGLPPRVLEYLKPPAVITAGGRRLSVRSHTGLIGKARLIDGAKSNTLLQVGEPIFESIRALPKNPMLVVALDSRLERIERVDATSALSSLSFVTSTSDTGLPADCLLGKPLDSVSGTLTASLNPSKLAQSESAPAPDQTSPNNLGGVGYGLFSLTRSLISGTLSLQEEAIKPAINRLGDKLRSLMALKMLRLSENRAASKLPVRVTLEEIGSKENKLIIRRQTFKLEQTDESEIDGFIPEVPVGSRVRYHLFNDSTKPLYYTLINVDPRERLSAFCPATVDTSASPASDSNSSDNGISAISSASIPSGGSVTVPSVDLDWAVTLPAGPIETYVVCTTRPLDKTFNLLLKDINNGGQRINPLPAPLDVIRAILSDISRDDDTDTYTLDMSEWATLNFTYQAV